MLQQLIVVKVTLVTELAERMAPMGGVLRVTLDAMTGEVLA